MPGAYGWRSAGSGGCRATDRIFHLPDSFTGLSPLARGTHQLFPPACYNSPFIPARAGNTNRAPPANCCSPVYPRSRGEHAQSDKPFVGLVRFIPARAGNTVFVSDAPRAGSVYPRSRGEHAPLAVFAWLLSGLSPLARGTLPFANIARQNSRFIPARAGNTKKPPLVPCRHPVYPRSRGEHCWIYQVIQRGSGLSPLARGTRNVALSKSMVTRFIPARAGNT